MPNWIKDPKFKALVREVVSHRLVAFAGSGVSRAAGCPTWYELLRDLLKALRPSSFSTWFDGLLESGDYLQLAEVLQDSYRGQLVEHIKHELENSACGPSALHRAIAGVDFSQVVTTNYDQLLEQAYHESGRLARPLRVHTWKDPLAILRDLRHNYFAIVKIHGTVDKDETMITKRSDYMALLHNNVMFQSCLKTILLTKTLLFVGHSLRDPDLLSLLGEISREYREKDGPLANPHFHYALLPESEANDLSIRRIRDDFNIWVFVYSGSTNDEKERNVEDFLKQLGAETSKELVTAALTRQTDLGGGPLQDIQSLVASPGTLFVRDAVLERLLNVAVLATNSLRGDVCLIRDDETHAVTDLLKLSQGPHDTDAPKVVVPQSVIGSTFHAELRGAGAALPKREDPGEPYIYLPNIADLTSIEREFPGIRYVSCHRDVHSELAVKIIADGETVGVLNLESRKESAYDSGHIAIARDLARKAGGIFAAARDRTHRGKSLQAIYQIPWELTNIIHGFAGLEEIDGIIYSADYNVGELVGHHCGGGDPMRFQFNNKASFAVRVLSQELPEFLEVVTQAIEDGKVDPEGIRRYGIKGALYGTPVHAFGIPAGVFVAWSKSVSFVPGMADIVQRIVHLIVNDLSEGFRETRRVLGFHDEIKTGQPDVLGVAMDKILSIGLERVRLWSWTGEDFECVASKGLNEKENAHRSCRSAVRGSNANVYCQLIHGRYLTDPHARIQRPTMYGADPMAQELCKDPKGDWIVCPVVDRDRTLVGYIAADNHVGQQHKLESVPENSFILRALDVIAVMLIPALKNARDK